ncbi:MAG: ketopantoate reductase family protein [Negativicutes bacterium]|nr:ketopantoate reductase family protein [Negativicutes bacterium]
MKIAIIGAGAMGCLYGSYLAKGRETVTLLDTWQEHTIKINSAGLSLISSSDKFVAQPRATIDANDVGPSDLILICVKATQTTEAAMLAELFIKPETIVLSLQNGLGNLEQLAEMLGPQRLLVGTTLMGASVLEPGLVMHSGIKNTHIASWTGGSDARLSTVAAILSRAGLPAVIENNVASLLWSKLSIHAGLNAVTAITRATNRKFLQRPEAVRLARMAVAEVAAVATAAGIPLLYPNCAQEMLSYAESMQEYQSPMLQDVLHKRKTEIDAINGAVILEGRKLGIPTPVNETLTLTMKTIESLY